MRHCLAIFLLALPLVADCRLPDLAPDALTSMSAADLVESGHDRRAIQVLEPIVKEHPEDGNSAWLLSRAKASLGDLEAAMPLAEAALATDDANPAYHVQVALVAGRQAQGVSLLKQLTLVRRARKELEAALVIDAVNPPAQFSWTVGVEHIDALTTITLAGEPEGSGITLTGPACLKRLISRALSSSITENCNVYNPNVTIAGSSVIAYNTSQMVTVQVTASALDTAANIDDIEENLTVTMVSNI